MDKLIVAALSLVGGVLVASGMIAHLALIEQIGIPLDKQVLVGSTLVMIALAVHLLMGGRLFPWQR